MANMTVETKHETYHDCYLIVDSYLADSSLVLEIWNDEYGPIARITTCLHRLTVHEDEAFVDTNNCPWAEDFIREYQLGEFTGRNDESGFCTYPLYKFDIRKIREYSRK